MGVFGNLDTVSFDLHISVNLLVFWLVLMKNEKKVSTKIYNLTKHPLCKNKISKNPLKIYHKVLKIRR